MPTWKSAVLEQQRSNEESWNHRKSFASHRARLTAMALGESPHGRICILGAGNCADLDLEEVAKSYEEVHLVDIDGAALGRALSACPAELAQRIQVHPGVDLSGLEENLDRWGRMQVTPEELMAYPAETAKRIRLLLGRTFDRVLSACLLSQLHLLTRRVLSEQHPLFSAVTFCLNLAHLRTLLELTHPQGRALLATDVTSNEIVSLSDEDCKHPLEYLGVVLSQQDVFQAVDPRVLAAILADDPLLAGCAQISAPHDAWLWQNGPDRRFLVYAATLTPNR